MGDERYRVAARPLPEGDDFIVEHFARREDAEAYYKELQSDDGLLPDAPYRAMRLELAEFVNGTWTVASRRLVITGGGERGEGDGRHIQGQPRHGGEPHQDQHDGGADEVHRQVRA